MKNVCTNSVEVQIPFRGFGSVFDDWLSYWEHDLGEEEYNRISDLFSDEMDYSKAFIEYSKIYTEYLADIVSEKSGHKFKMEFVELSNPKEYNFSTDRIFVRMQFSDMQYVHYTVTEHAIDGWMSFVKQRCTSYDGFTSSYQSDCSKWPYSLEYWEEAQRGLLLEFYINRLFLVDGEKMWDELESYILLEPWLSNDGLERMIWDCVSDKFKNEWAKVPNNIDNKAS